MGKGKSIDLTGQRFGKLMVIEKAEKPTYLKTNSIYWKCLCDCGEEKIANGAGLRKGTTKSCGHCLKTSPLEVGQKFGMLTILAFDHRTKHGSYWLCQCECGNQKVVSSNGLKYGTQSCGCLQKIAAAKSGKNHFIDLTGKKFGMLTAIKVYEKENRKERDPIYWLCNCECGNETIVSAGNLTGKNGTKSCGCLNYCNDLSGKRFGRLLVIRIFERRMTANGTRIFWLCKCDCGNEKIANGCSLASGATKSCGCLHLETNKANGIKNANKTRGTGNYVLRSIYAGYKSNAKTRKIGFYLSKEEFYNLIIDKCYYCGVISSNSRTNPVTEEVFYHNGVDRLSSDKDYTTDNCVTCCKVCNNAKQSMSEDEFFAWIDRVYHYRYKPIKNSFIIQSELTDMNIIAQ